MFLGEATRTLDQRFRLSLPEDMAERLVAGSSECLIAKERRGCLSLWNREHWEEHQRQAAEILKGKLASGRLERRLADVQRLGRLLSTRQRVTAIAGRGRLVIPEGFRELLAVEPGGSVNVVGAAVCVELWHPEAWADHLAEALPGYRDLYEDLVS
ncbi:division/cell wall cluster transcriptional repressor MraZ [Botrimarina hoheduenensis]|uniref:division/cell wall cluster transcriptional repressor MraZ n=1 Tax=Botrimarina hoheduenensis TaxID=2528000 RepID=UPI0011B3C574|nr:division/cell wall cluster transcriptional repressor MraZ [Botrimarina hoheduenensis]